MYRGVDCTVLFTFILFKNVHNKRLNTWKGKRKYCCQSSCWLGGICPGKSKPGTNYLAKGKGRELKTYIILLNFFFMFLVYRSVKIQFILIKFLKVSRMSTYLFNHLMSPYYAPAMIPSTCTMCFTYFWMQSIQKLIWFQPLKTGICIDSP